MPPAIQRARTAPRKLTSTIRALEPWKYRKLLHQGKNEKNGIAEAIPFLSCPTMFSYREAPFGKVPLFAMCFILAPSLRRAAAVLSCAGQEPSARIRSSGAPCRRSLSPAIRSAPTMVRMRCAMMRTACFVQSGRGCGRNSGFIFRVQADSGFLRQDGKTVPLFQKDDAGKEKGEMVYLKT